MIAESVGHRRPPSRKRGSKTGFVVDPFRKRSIWFESGLEESWLQVLIASPTVADVKEQQQLELVMDGEKRKHFFDFVITTVCGRRDAYAVKYHDQVSHDLRALLECAAETVGDRFAHRFAILNDRALTKTMIANARRIISCGADWDYEAQGFLVDRLKNGAPEITLAQCDVILGDGNRGSRAATALLQAGKLVLKHCQLLGPDTILSNGYAF